MRLSADMRFRFADRPMAIAPGYLAAMLGQCVERFGVVENGRVVGVETRVDGEVVEFKPTAMATAGWGEPYAVTPSGVAVIGVYGVLMHKASPWAFEQETSYPDIGDAVAGAMKNPDVRAIAMHVSSPGGEVDGCFELSDTIHSLRGQKPMVAICDPYAYSAAYAIASACDSISVPRTGGAGSIGVLAMHMEYSKALADAGVGITMFTFGDRKTDLSPFAPMSEDAKERMQADIDSMGSMFVDLVARNRGLSKAHVRNTKAGMFMGSNAVDMKLADGVFSPSEAFSALEGALVS